MAGVTDQVVPVAVEIVLPAVQVMEGADLLLTAEAVIRASDHHQVVVVLPAVAVRLAQDQEPVPAVLQVVMADHPVVMVQVRAGVAGPTAADLEIPAQEDHRALHDLLHPGVHLAVRNHPLLTEEVNQVHHLPVVENLDQDGNPRAPAEANLLHAST